MPWHRSSIVLEQSGEGLFEMRSDSRDFVRVELLAGALLFLLHKYACAWTKQDGVTSVGADAIQLNHGAICSIAGLPYAYKRSIRVAERHNTRPRILSLLALDSLAARCQAWGNETADCRTLTSSATRLRPFSVLHFPFAAQTVTMR